MRSTFGAGLTQCGMEGMRFVEVQWLGGLGGGADLGWLSSDLGRWEGEQVRWCGSSGWEFGKVGW